MKSTTKGRSWYRGEYDRETGNIIGNDGFSAPPPSAIRAAEQRLSAMAAMAERIRREMGEPPVRIAEGADGVFEIETAHYITKFTPVNTVQIDALRGLATQREVTR